MQPRTQLIALTGIFLFLLIIVELVRRRQLRVGYSLIWLLTGGVGVVLFSSPGLLNWLARLVGVSKPNSLLFTAGIAFTFLILLANSITLTILWRQDKALAQQQALADLQARELAQRVAQLEAQLAAGAVQEKDEDGQ